MNSIKNELYVGATRNGHSGSKHFTMFAMLRIANDTAQNHLARYAKVVTAWCKQDEVYREEIIAMNEQTLTCSCSPGMMCHAEVLRYAAIEQAGMIS